MKILAEAVIPTEKLTNYQLTPRPQDDKSKFLSQVGFGVAVPDLLLADIRQLTATQDAIEDGENEYGHVLPHRRSLTWSERTDTIRSNDLAAVEDRRNHTFRDIETLETVTLMELFDRVALRQDLPEQSLKRGDVATLVDYVPQPANGERGCILEIFNAVGDSLAVVAVPESAVEPLRANEIMAVRPLAKAV